MKGIAIFIAIAMLTVPWGNIIEAEEEKASVTVIFYGFNTPAEIRREMTISEAKKLVNKLNSTREKDMATLLSLLNFSDADKCMAKIGENISNYMSFVFGAGRGIALYTGDLAFFFLALLITDAFGAIILTTLFAILTHLVPLRFALPVMLIGIENGVITTVGIRGVQSAGSDTGIMLIGFVGIIINFFIPTPKASLVPFFIAGYSLAVLPNPFG